MDNIKPFAPAVTLPETGTAPDSDGPTTTTEAQAADAPVLSAADARFKSCRWRATPDQGPFCTHRDVLPFAGKEGFSADSWCLECAFYKLRRTPKKRDYSQY
jgi:hypothetical protein